MVSQAPRNASGRRAAKGGLQASSSQRRGQEGHVVPFQADSATTAKPQPGLAVNANAMDEREGTFPLLSLLGMTVALLVGRFGTPYLPAQDATTLVVLFWGFLANRLWTFAGPGL